MFSNFAGETLFYRYDARRSKDGDLPPGQIIIRVNELTHRISGSPESNVVTTRLASWAIRIREASS